MRLDREGVELYEGSIGVSGFRLQRQTCLTLSGVETPVNLALSVPIEGGEAVENAAIRAHVEAAPARRKELFALGQSDSCGFAEDGLRSSWLSEREST
jgi:hypothetical protein